YAYESGFSVKWLIQAQINQMRTGVVDPIAGDLSEPNVSPWIGWAAYTWANGSTPRSDGLTWVPADFTYDGTHPAGPGRAKFGNQEMGFFLSSPFTACWFAFGICG